MGFGSTPKAPPVVIPPPAAAPATAANPAVAQAAANQKSKSVAGVANTPEQNKALQTPSTANVTLLGD